MNKKALLGISLVVLFSLSVFFSPITAQEQELNIAFNLNLLSPNTSPARNQWSLLMEQQLPKIGVGVTFHESTGWGNIAPRTWSYPVGVDYDYIPTYAEGGFDILFVGWSWDLDWDPTGLYDIPSTSPAGDNFYQYANPTYDSILNSYLTELDTPTRIQYAYQLQDILYEDLPAICLVYPRSLFGFRSTVSGVNGILIASSNHRAEYWDNDDHIIRYGIPADLRETNIFVAESYYDYQWMVATYGAMTMRNKDTSAWETQMANSTTLVPNAANTLLNISVVLDPDARFSDGEYLTAEDVKYTYELHMTPAVGSSSYSYLNTWFTSNDSIEIVTPGIGGELNFVLDGFYVFADLLLSFGLIDMYVGDGTGVSELISSYGYSIFNDMPGTGNAGWNLVKGSGPFMMQSYDSVASVVTMVPNPYYSGDAALLTELYLTFVAGKDSAVSKLIAGTLDIMDAQYFPVLSDFEGQAEIEGVLIKDPSHQEMGMNLKHPQIGTGELCPIPGVDSARYIRKAISHAVPRQTIVNEILEGLGAPGITATPDSVVEFNDELEPYAYDLEKAIEYMELAGYEIYPPTPTETGIAGLVFLSFLGLASILAFRRFRK